MNRDELTNIIANNPVVILDFYTEWCQPCKTWTRVLKYLESQKKLVVRIDVENDGNIAGQYNITSVPTIMVFRSGKLAKTVCGASQERIDLVRKTAMA